MLITEIIKANENHLELILMILNECEKWLVKHNYHHWKNLYTRNKIIYNISNKEVFVKKIGEKYIGTVTLSETEPEFYHNAVNPIKWTEKNVFAVYVSGLAVLPLYMNNGQGALLMDYTKKYALKKGFSYIRLDTAGAFVGLSKFYEKLGFKNVDNQKILDFESLFWEKKL